MIKKIVIIPAILSFFIISCNLFAEANIENKITSMIEQNSTTCEKYYGSKYFANKEGTKWTPMLYTDNKCTTEFTGENLFLNNSKIINLTPISELKNLLHLYLGNNQLKNIELLSNLTNLEVLDVSYNYLTSIEPVSGFEKLKFLKADHNRLTNISSISDLEDLEYVDMSYNQILRMEPMPNLNKLREFILVGNPIMK